MITRKRDDLCLPSAEDTDVTALYQDHMIKPDHLSKSLEPVLKDKPLASHDPVGLSLDSEMSQDQVSHDPVVQASHDSVASHDMDTLMASLSVFDTTHLGRLGTAVSMETSSMFIQLFVILLSR